MTPKTIWCFVQLLHKTSRTQFCVLLCSAHGVRFFFPATAQQDTRSRKIKIFRAFFPPQLYLLALVEVLSRCCGGGEGLFICTNFKDPRGGGLYNWGELYIWGRLYIWEGGLCPPRHYLLTIVHFSPLKMESHLGNDPPPPVSTRLRCRRRRNASGRPNWRTPGWPRRGRPLAPSPPPREAIRPSSCFPFPLVGSRTGRGGGVSKRCPRGLAAGGGRRSRSRRNGRPRSALHRGRQGRAPHPRPDAHTLAWMTLRPMAGARRRAGCLVPWGLRIEPMVEPPVGSPNERRDDHHTNVTLHNVLDLSAPLRCVNSRIKIPIQTHLYESHRLPSPGVNGPLCAAIPVLPWRPERPSARVPSRRKSKRSGAPRNRRKPGKARSESESVRSWLAGGGGGHQHHNDEATQRLLKDVFQS